MPLATLHQVLDEAAKGCYGVGAFNANNMEQVQGIVGAAQEERSPVIVQVSRGALSYAGDNYLRHLILAAAEDAPEIPIVLHLDHGDQPPTCRRAIDLGFTSVMMDGSLLADGKTPSDYERLPDTHLVMHGSSSVPQELVDRINAAGGRLEATFGVPIEEIQEGIRHGVRKINVDTDGRLAITAALREAVAANPAEFDPRAFFKPARDAIKTVVAERLRQFGSAGRAGDYEVLSRAEMANRYASTTANV